MLLLIGSWNNSAVLAQDAYGEGGEDPVTSDLCDINLCRKRLESKVSHNTSAAWSGHQLK